MRAHEHLCWCEVLRSSQVSETTRPRGIGELPSLLFRAEKSDLHQQEQGDQAGGTQQKQ